MKIIKYVTFITSAAILLFLFISLLLPSTKSVEYKITINQPVDSVYKRVINLRDWQEWTPWSSGDPEVLNSYAGLISTPGSRWVWSGKTAGEGELVIESAQPGQRIETSLSMTRPQKMQSRITWQFTDVNSKTQLKWVNKKDLRYPFGRWAGLLKKDQLNTDFEQGLHRLKEVCEREL